jgi:hypothetical protein
MTDVEEVRLKRLNVSELTGKQKNYLADLLIDGKHTTESMAKITGLEASILGQWKFKRR